MNENEKVLEEVNPMDEYLNNYKEQELAEFCVQKDKEIENRKKERQELIEQLAEMRHKVDKYDKTFENVKELYSKIKEMSVDDYLKLYHMILEDVSGYNKASIATISSDGLFTLVDLEIENKTI